MSDLNFLTAHDYIGQKSPFHVMVKPIGPVCNLDCNYCYYLEKATLYTGEGSRAADFRMKDAVLEKFIRNYIQSQPGDRVDFAWQGGEPTLNGIEYFRKIVELQKQYGDGKQITNSLQTNGTLIDEEWAEFLAVHNILVGISVDGPPELHDHFRTFKHGKGSFSRVMETVRLFHKYRVPFNTLTVVNDRNAKMPLKVYRFLKDIGSDFMQFIPIVEREADDPSVRLKLVANDYAGEAWVTEESVEPLEFGRFLSRIFDEWVRLDVGKHYVNYFDNTLAAYAGELPSLCTMRPVCGAALVLEHNGDFYSCDHFVYPEHLLGNIMDRSMEEMFNSEEQINFGMNKQRSLPEVCRSCEFLRACGGDCPKHRFLETDNGEKISYLHDGFLYFFRHVDKHMKFMAEELRNQRPPANVMNLFSEQEKKKLLLRSRFHL